MKKIVLMVMACALACGARAGRLELKVKSRLASRLEKREASLKLCAEDELTKMRLEDPRQYDEICSDGAKKADWIRKRINYYKGGWKKSYDEEAAARAEQQASRQRLVAKKVVYYYVPNNMPYAAKSAKPSARKQKDVDVFDELPAEVRDFFKDRDIIVK